MDRLISAIAFVKNMIACKNFQTRHKTDRRAFSKDGILSFERVMLFVLGRTNTLLDFEILNFCKKQGMEAFAKSAMVEARKKIDSGAFRQILQNLSHVLPKDKLFKGYQLVAVDGTELQLPKSPEITKIYGTKKDNCNWPRAHVVSFYDVLNHHYLDAYFDSYPCSVCLLRKHALRAPAFLRVHVQYVCSANTHFVRPPSCGYMFSMFAPQTRTSCARLLAGT